MEFVDCDWTLGAINPANLRRNNSTTAALNRWHTLVLISGLENPSQLQLARTTGLRTSTMSNIIRDLKRLGLVRDSGPLDTDRVGPKEGGLEVNADAAWAVGLELDPSGHEIALVNLGGHVVARRHLPPGLSWHEALEAVPEIVDQLAPIARVDRGTCVGMGVSVAGIVDASKGVVLYSRSLDMKNENLVETAEKLGVGPVSIERDVNCGLYAEYKSGAARKHQTCLYFLARPGFSGLYQFGLGLLLNGHIFHGLSSAAGELDTLLTPTLPSSTERAIDYDQFYRECGVRLASLINVLDIGRVIVSGDDPQFTEARLKLLREQVESLLLPVPNRKVDISRAQLGVAGILQGAALLAVSRHLREVIFSDIQSSKGADKK